jgi:phospholipase C
MFSTLSVLTASALISSTFALPVSRQASTWETLRSKITHVVYLTLENHSFDNIAGESQIPVPIQSAGLSPCDALAASAASNAI